MSLNSKVRAFTLLECLVALLVIAGSVQVYQGLTTVLVSNVKQSSATDFRKTNADGRGYQPMLFNVKASTISQNNQIVTIQVTLKNGLQRSFVYAFEKTG